jgi:hypothetical protein
MGILVVGLLDVSYPCCRYLVVEDGEGLAWL